MNSQIGCLLFKLFGKAGTMERPAVFLGYNAMLRAADSMNICDDDDLICSHVQSTPLPFFRFYIISGCLLIAERADMPLVLMRTNINVKSSFYSAFLNT